MQLASTSIAEMKGRSTLSATLALKTPFDEAAVWRDNKEYISKCLELPEGIEVVLTDDARLATPEEAAKIDPLGKAKNVVPMEPDVFPC